MKKIEFSPPDIGEEEIEEIAKVLRSGWITTGPRSKEFENLISRFVGGNEVASLNSATAGLELTLRLLGIGTGDEVIVPAYTYTASAAVVCHVGAKLILVDVQKNRYEMDYNALERSITTKTKAIIPVEIAGVMCDYEKLFHIVEEKKSLFVPANEVQAAVARIAVISDSAHALGSQRKFGRTWKVAGEMADFSVFSFHAVKNVTTAEGGAVCWRRDISYPIDVYRQFMLLSLHGQTKDAFSKEKSGNWEYDILFPGYKANMTDIQAALGIKQLERYGVLLDKRRQIVNAYTELLNEPCVDLIDHYTDTIRSSCHLMLTRISGFDESMRNQVIRAMSMDHGIACNVHYKPLPMLSAYKKLGFSIDDFPNAYNMYRNEVSLPCHTLLSLDDVEYIVSSYLKVINSMNMEVVR